MQGNRKSKKITFDWKRKNRQIKTRILVDLKVNSIENLRKKIVNWTEKTKKSWRTNINWTKKIIMFVNRYFTNRTINRTIKKTNNLQNKFLLGFLLPK